jgi:hypothetical protein
MMPQMIRIVYKVEEKPDQTIVIVVIGLKKNEEAYTKAKKIS